MKTNTQHLTGVALDWAVAKCELPKGWPADEIILGEETDYSSDWAQGGPIIEREGMQLDMEDKNVWNASMWWDDTDGTGEVTTKGPSPLIAAMRCYVASKLGAIVDIPDELIK